MNYRIWYPQLDMFDTVRRISTLLQFFDSPPGLERLYIADFFLANPPLLHKTRMSMDTRSAFRELCIPKPGKTFLDYPSAPLLFNKMESIQKSAIANLSSKALIDMEKLDVGKVELTNQGFKLLLSGVTCTESEAKLCVFLSRNFAAGEDVGNKDLRERTGLRRLV